MSFELELDVSRFRDGHHDTFRLAVERYSPRLLPALRTFARDDVEAHGGYQAIWRRDNPRVYFGGSDPRKDGAAMGY